MFFCVRIVYGGGVRSRRGVSGVRRCEEQTGGGVSGVRRCEE